MSVIFGHGFLVHQRSGFKGPLHLCVDSYIALTLLAVERAPVWVEEVDRDSEVNTFVIELYEGGGEGQESLEDFNLTVVQENPWWSITLFFKSLVI